MKSLLAILASLITLNSFAGEYTVDFKQLSTWSEDYKIAKIKEARFQVSAASRGGILRYCYKDYESNFPYAPQKRPYYISQNLELEIEGTKILFGDLVPLFEKLKDELQDDLKLGCGTTGYMGGLIISESEDGTEYRSDFTIYYKKGKVVMAASSYHVEMKPNETTVVDLVTSVYYGDSWDRMWNMYDPAVGNPQSNY